jgi:hypothetical protein
MARARANNQSRNFIAADRKCPLRGDQVFIDEAPAPAARELARALRDGEVDAFALDVQAQIAGDAAQLHLGVRRLEARGAAEKRMRGL